MWGKMMELFVFLGNVVKHPSNYEAGTATEKVDKMIEEIVSAFRPECRPKDQKELIGRLKQKAHPILDRCLEWRNPNSEY
jgi:hypothetical protein